MKKVLLCVLGLCIIASTSLNSCKSHDVPPVVTTAAQTAAIDAAATLKFMFETWELGAGVPATEAGIGLIAVAVGAAASLEGGERAGLPHATNHNPYPSLPSTYELSNNPFEKYGQSHNLCLNWYIEGAGLDSTKVRIVRLDNNFLDTLVTQISTITTTKDTILSAFSTTNMGTLINGNNNFYEKDESLDDFLKVVDVPETDSLYQRIDTIGNTILTMEVNDAPLAEYMEYLNSKILQALHPEVAYTKNEVCYLVFLTVLKHSIYYWK